MPINGPWPIADWYNRSWAKGKRQRATLVVQRFKPWFRPLWGVIAHHPSRQDEEYIHIQTLETMKETKDAVS